MTKPSNPSESLQSILKDCLRLEDNPVLDLRIEYSRVGHGKYAPRLFSDNSKQGGMIILQLENLKPEDVTVHFDDGQIPIQGPLYPSFNLGSVPSPWNIKENAEGKYLFSVEALDKILDRFQIHVSRDGTLEKSGFKLTRKGSCLQMTHLCFWSSPSKATIRIINETVDEQDLTIGKSQNSKNPMSQPKLRAGECSTIPLEIAAGDPINVSLEVPDLPLELPDEFPIVEDQNGGTEEVHILIETG